MGMCCLSKNSQEPASLDDFFGYFTKAESSILVRANRLNDSSNLIDDSYTDELFKTHVKTTINTLIEMIDLHQKQEKEPPKEIFDFLTKARLAFIACEEADFAPEQANAFTELVRSQLSSARTGSQQSYSKIVK